ncbi:SIS domain-containing protein [Nocardioides zeae]|uniref:SIS domain-containing protein n=1 Tax=Nocardioides imazamoxiresistens TaxID=3231893 RepID=A0ABU3Q080_9ACTN|nr:SIS domain-containing protein [Nocardioides zeae]MDT9594923.1 SIS domain-containing protein [Nocardioides zeae]
MWFDESRLDDEHALAGVDAALRTLAESGARVRREAGAAGEASASRVDEARQRQRPRAVLAAGPDARLLRDVLESTCPVPFVAWPAPGLPGWVGSLDLVVMLAPQGSDAAAAGAVAEAVRRGADVLVACPPGSLVAEHAVGRDVVLLPTDTGDPLATAVVVLDFLASAGLGRPADADDVAAALDEIAVRCSPLRDIAANPAKEAALGLAESAPLVWGGSPLAARAARRVAEDLRRATGRAVLADDADQILPVVEAARARDVFADPVDGDAVVRPALLVLDDGNEEAHVRERAGRLRAAAAAHDVRVVELAHTGGSDVARHASLLLQGRYAATYLGLGLVDGDR